MGNTLPNRHQHVGVMPFHGHKLIWKAWAPLWVNQEPELIDHIIAKCSFTREVWFHILQALGKQLPQGAPSTLSWWRRLRALSTGAQQKGMDSLFVLVSWRVEGTQCMLLPKRYDIDRGGALGRSRCKRAGRADNVAICPMIPSLFVSVKM
jgi:hypothetical protein